VLKLLQESGLTVCWMREAALDLEQVFIQVTGRATHAGSAPAVGAPQAGAGKNAEKKA
jgi:hypothetical protein